MPDNKITEKKLKKLSDEYVPLRVIIIYSLLLYASWTLYNFLLRPLTDNIQNDVLAAFIDDGVIKNLLWTLPAALLIYKYRDKLLCAAKEMFAFRKEHLKYLWIFLLFTVYIILGIVIHGGTLGISGTFGAEDIVTVLFVGITEEMVFRGWLLNSTAKRHKEISVTVNAVMFLCIHFPKWIYEGAFVSNFTSGGFLSIALLSIIFSVVFLETKSLVLPVTLHMYWDLLMFIFY